MRAAPAFLSSAGLLLLSAPVSAADDCQAVTWAASGTGPVATAIPSVVRNSTTPQLGEVSCRFWIDSDSSVNYYSCKDLADRFWVDLDDFFALNPTVQRDCSNIQPNSRYCVRGYLQPLLALDRVCGPTSNATCLGTDYPCCNAHTLTCGNSSEDCAPGTCYEGACGGDKVWSTDGTCGSQYGNRKCSGILGDCCDMSGACGTGEAFCGLGNCQSGNCDAFEPANSTETISWLQGNTTDGTCGGSGMNTCNVVYGFCCNKDGRCGSSPADCGVGCSPPFGQCANITSTTSDPWRPSTYWTSSSSKSTATSSPKSSTSKSSKSTSSKSSTSKSSKSTSSKPSTTPLKTSSTILAASSTKLSSSSKTSTTPSKTSTSSPSKSSTSSKSSSTKTSKSSSSKSSTTKTSQSSSSKSSTTKTSQSSSSKSSTTKSSKSKSSKSSTTLNPSTTGR